MVEGGRGGDGLRTSDSLHLLVLRVIKLWSWGKTGCPPKMEREENRCSLSVNDGADHALGTMPNTFLALNCIILAS